MNNIRIIKTGINVSKIVRQLEKYPEDWGGQKGLDGAEQIDPDFHKIYAGVLQLVMGAITKPGEMVYNTEICIKTPAHDRHSEVIGFIKRHFHAYRQLKSFLRSKANPREFQLVSILENGKLLDL